MKVSILVPVYGVEKYIERCAESLFGQTYEDIEYIFVDDCTPDSSISILREVIERHPARKDRVRLLRNEKNSGLGATRVAALAAATGDAVMHVDSDDFIPLAAVELLVRKMEETGADMVDGGWQRVTRQGLSDVNTPCHETDRRRYLTMMLTQNIVSNRVWGRLYRRSLYAAHGITFVPGVDYGEDYSVMPRLVFFAKRAYIDDCVYFYSDENASSYTHNVSAKHIRSYVRANRVVYDFFTANDKERVFSTPLQLGMMNMLRNVRLSGVSFTEVDSLCPYRPGTPLFRLQAWLFRSRCPYRIANTLYLAVRKLYLFAALGGAKVKYS